jgi:hypothetical protein
VDTEASKFSIHPYPSESTGLAVAAFTASHIITRKAISDEASPENNK